MAAFSARCRTYKNGVLQSTETRSGIYTDSLSCATEETRFAALAPADKLTATSTSFPAAPTGFHYVGRDCSTTVDQTPVTSSTGGDDPNLTIDTSGETNANFYTSTSSNG